MDSSPDEGISGYVYVPGGEISNAEKSAGAPVPEEGISAVGSGSEEEVEEGISAVGSGSQEEFEEEREETVRTLPAELAEGVVVLECESTAEGGYCDVYLVGTAHVSQVILTRSIYLIDNFALFVYLEFK